MESRESILALERRPWNADETFYRETLSEEAVLVLPEPTGVLDRPAALESVGDGDRWRRVDVADERLVDVGSDAVQVIYRARAERSEDGSEYAALVTTTSVREDGSWRLVSHQQTPVGG